MIVERITVILWAYKRNDMLTQALNSVLNQHCATEILDEIIVSDNSPDGEAYTVIKNFNDPRIKYIQQRPTLSAQAHLPALLDYMKGKWCAHLCDDDIWLPWHLIESIESINKTQSKMYFSGRIYTESTNLRFGIVDSSPLFLADNAWVEKISYEETCAALAFETHLMLSAMVVYVPIDANLNGIKTTVAATHPLRADAAYFATLMPTDGILYNSRPTIIYRKHGGQSAFSLKDHETAQREFVNILDSLLLKKNRELKKVILKTIEKSNMTGRIYCSANWWRIASLMVGVDRPLQGWSFLKAKIKETIRHHGLGRFMSRMKQII